MAVFDLTENALVTIGSPWVSQVWGCEERVLSDVGTLRRADDALNRQSMRAVRWAEVPHA